MIAQVAGLLHEDRQAQVATLVTPIVRRAERDDPNVVKVVTDRHSRALYFSRAPIPWPRDPTATAPDALRHIGIYGYRVRALRQLARTRPCGLEQQERLEQLRALWLGLPLRVAEACEAPPGGVDTESDLIAARRRCDERAGPPWTPPVKCPRLRPFRPDAHTVNRTPESRPDGRLDTSAAQAAGEPRPGRRILFVCMGNICRSPTAEGVFRKVLRQRAPDLAIRVDSAGTHAYHVGEPPDHRARRAAARRGIDLSGQRARKVTLADFSMFDLVLAMDEGNFQVLSAMSPPEYQSRIRLFLDFAPGIGRRNVPDPYYGGSTGFEHVLDLVEEASRGLVAHLLEPPDVGQ